MFGDRHAAAISAVCIKETAVIFKYLAAAMIDNNMYVDNITSETNIS